jgi:activator of the mannose operon (transcriptional antiterminator)
MTSTLLNNKIVETLLNEDNTTIKKISEEINLSEKTTRLKVKKVDDYLKSHNLGCIESKPRVGISLKVSDEQRLRLLELIYHNKLSFEENEASNDKLIYYLLLNSEKDYITKLELANKLYVSIPTLTNYLKKCDEWFQNYNLKIVSIQKKGIRLQGEEFYKRILIQDFILSHTGESFEYLMSSFFKGLEIPKIKTVVQKVEKSWKVKFSKESFNKIIVIISLSLTRFKNKIDFIDNEKVDNYIEYQFSKNIYDDLKKVGYKNFNEEDIKLLTLDILTSYQLESGKMLSAVQLNDGYSKKLRSLVVDIIQTVSQVLEEDLTNDKILKEELIQHLKSAIFRIRYGEKNPYSISSQIKNEYKDSFLSVWSTSQFFEEYFDIQVTEVELGYIALYIQASRMRKNKHVDISFVTNKGRAQSIFLAELLKEKIPQISSINIIRVEDIGDINDHNQIVISNSEIQLEKTFKGHLFYISNMPDEKEIDELRKFVNSKDTIKQASSYLFNQSLKTLFDPNLILLNLDSLNKEEILGMMVEKLECQGYVKSDFLRSVMSREKVTSTSIGNQTAIPHGSITSVNENKIVIATLKKPIVWFDEELVDMIFLLGMKMNSKENVELAKIFFKDLIRFSEDKNLLNEFKKSKNNILAYEELFV